MNLSVSWGRNFVQSFSCLLTRVYSAHMACFPVQGLSEQMWPSLCACHEAYGCENIV